MFDSDETIKVYFKIIHKVLLLISPSSYYGHILHRQVIKQKIL